MSEHTTTQKRWGMVIDQDRCIGCWTCAVACKEENNQPEGVWWNHILTVGGEELDTPAGEWPELELAYQPVNCFHCENPPCVRVCPVGATYQRDDGIVMMDYDRCIGCRYCMVSCPYSVRVFNWEEPTQIPPAEGTFHVGAAEKGPRPKGVVEKCDFCYHRVDDGLQPFCIEVCPARARIFGDLNDPDSDVSELIRTKPTERVREDLGTEPSVYYITPRGGGRRNEPQAIDPERHSLDTTEG